MERLSQRTVESWDDVHVRGWQQEWSPKIFTSPLEPADEGDWPFCFSYQQKNWAKGGQCKAYLRHWEMENNQERQNLQLVLSGFPFFLFGITSISEFGGHAHIYQSQEVFICRPPTSPRNPYSFYPLSWLRNNLLVFFLLNIQHHLPISMSSSYVEKGHTH